MVIAMVSWDVMLDVVVLSAKDGKHLPRDSCQKHLCARPHDMTRYTGSLHVCEAVYSRFIDEMRPRLDGHIACRCSSIKTGRFCDSYNTHYRLFRHLLPSSCALNPPTQVVPHNTGTQLRPGAKVLWYVPTYKHEKKKTEKKNVEDPILCAAITLASAKSVALLLYTIPNKSWPG